MEYIAIKNSTLVVSRLCMGGCPMGGYGWGDVKEQELIEAVQAALDHGVTMFDTADTYGLGKSEEILGKALGSRRQEVVVATKFGVRMEHGHTFYDNSPQWIYQAVENSLKRLGTEYIDIYQIHYRDGMTPLEDVVHTLEELKKQGKIRYYGLSNIYAADMEELRLQKHSFVGFQDEYSLACRTHEKDILLLSDRLALTPFTWGSLGQGILTGKYDRTCSFGKDDRRSRDIYVNFHGEKLEKNLAIVDVLRVIAEEVQRPISAVAIRFILDYLPESVVLAGIKNQSQVRGNCEAFGWKLTKEQLERLELISR